MSFLASVLPILVLGVAVLMVGVLVTRAPQQSLQSAFSEGLCWGIGIFLCFSTEILILENM